MLIRPSFRQLEKRAKWAILFYLRICYTLFAMKQSRIIIDPKILTGHPIIKGTRIPVSLVLNLLAHGYDFRRIIKAYPILTEEDIKAALMYSEARIKREEVQIEFVNQAK